MAEPGKEYAEDWGEAGIETPESYLLRERQEGVRLGLVTGGCNDLPRTYGVDQKVSFPLVGAKGGELA